MSRSRMAAAALMIPVAAGAVAVLGAGAASAVEPYSGEGYVAVRFDENETRFISAINAGELLDLIPNEFWSVSLEEGSVFENEEYVTSATIDQLVDEAAARGGMISFTINDPAIWSKNISIIQQW